MKEKNTYEQMLANLLTELKDITVATIAQSGVKENSRLAKSIEFVQSKEGINMVSSYYYPFVSEGRRKNIRKVPINALIEWIKQYNIQPRNGQTINQLAFAIQTSIYKNGIKAKNFEDKVMNATGEITQIAMADELSVMVADELVDMFDPMMG